MTIEQIKSVSIGDPVDDVKRKLRLRREPAVYDEDPTKSSYEYPADGFRVFFDANKIVETLVYEAPYSGEIDGVRIGDTKAAVLKKKGKPDRKWPVPDGIDRWLYEKEGFLRVDFAPLTGRVDTITR